MVITQTVVIQVIIEVYNVIISIPQQLSIKYQNPGSAVSEPT